MSRIEELRKAYEDASFWMPDDAREARAMITITDAIPALLDIAEDAARGVHEWDEERPYHSMEIIERLRRALDRLNE